MRFDKTNEKILKKIELQKPMQNMINPEISEIFKNYVEICHLNEKIKRSEITKKQKF
jgi:hypothetical protein